MYHVRTYYASGIMDMSMNRKRCNPFGPGHVWTKQGKKVKAFVIPEIRGASLHYSAPEVLRMFRENKETRSFDEVLRGDIYSFGCILHEITHGQPLWS